MCGGGGVGVCVRGMAGWVSCGIKGGLCMCVCRWLWRLG